MSGESLQQIIKQACEQKVIDAHAIDQDGSHVIVQGERIHYLSEAQVAVMLQNLLHRSRSRSEQSSNGTIEA